MSVIVILPVRHDPVLYLFITALRSHLENQKEMAIESFSPPHHMNSHSDSTDRIPLKAQ